MKSRYRSILLAASLAIGAVGLAGAALAVQPDEVLKDPALEARARSISSGLRCLVCQNQSVDDSDAPLARDLRLLVRERITAGDSDEAVRSFLVARYGEFVLLKPPFSVRTVLLWGAPFLLLAFAVYIVRRARLGEAGAVPGAGEPPLTADEQAKLDRLLKSSTD